MSSFQHKKSLGQNFLHDKNMIAKILRESGTDNNDSVIEIGPGTGNLTEEILKYTNNLTVIEVDQRAVSYLQDRFGDKINIINKDILKTDITKYISQERNNKIIGNLPYYISSQILFKVFENSKHFSSFTFMVQHEVGKRIIANKDNKDYGVLTLAVKMIGKAEYLFKVPRTVFTPQPNVDSAIIKIDFNGEDFDNELFKLIKSCFLNRRKKISNSIKNYFSDKESYNSFKNSSKVNKKVKEMLDLRPENLTVEDFQILQNEVNNFK